MSTTRTKGFGTSGGKPVGATAEKGVGWVATSNGNPVGTTAENKFDVLVGTAWGVACGYHKRGLVPVGEDMWGIK